ncbi:MAG: metallophosphoesterase family protein, partial [Acidimicrobiia bacterium]
NRFFPSLGDHEYSGGGIDPYLEFFTLPGEGVETSGTSGNERYYDIVRGPAHVFVLNVQPQEPDGASPTSIQGRWLQEQLAASTSPWRLVVSATPPFSSGNNHGSDPSVQWPFDEWGVDAVFSGDDHVYERIVHRGLPYFVSGLGGRSIHGFAQPVEGSEARYSEDFGVLMVEACDSSLEFEFHSVSDGIVDRFTLGDASCPRRQGGPPTP